MSRKSPLRSALGEINKTRILPKQQTFAPPALSEGVSLPPGNEPVGSLPPGNLPGGVQPGGEMPGGSLPGGEVTEGDLSQGKQPPDKLPPGNQPPGSSPGGNLTERDLPRGHQPSGPLPGVSLPVGILPPGNLPPGNLPMGILPKGNPPEGISPEGDLPSPGLPTDTPSEIPDSSLQDLNSDITTHRIAKRREKLLSAAIQSNPALLPDHQSNLIKQHLGNGWGRLAHCVTQVLKAPTRFRLKLVDIALILTIYDRTIARVIPRMYAPISGDDFRLDTGMDESNIRIGLKSLVEKQAIQKISTSSINFWALNHHYFAAACRGNLPEGKHPPGKLPGGEIPSNNPGNLPGGEGGQFTRGQHGSNYGNNKDFSVPKNLNQESEKESLSSDLNFPADMVARWSDLEKTGRIPNAKKEREIFQILFSNHGKQFFDHCGKVVTFLEEQGNGKSGEDGKIHSPMIWMNGHWDLNFTRYQTWIAKEQATHEAQAKKHEQELQRKAQQKEQELTQAKEFQEQENRKAQSEAVIQNLRRIYPSESDVKAFAEKAVQLSGCEFTQKSWRSLGWESPVVKSCVISHFLKQQSDPTTTQKRNYDEN